jgi:hypothetical protein
LRVILDIGELDLQDRLLAVRLFVPAIRAT